jgi:RecA-family ATPase
LIEIGQRAVQLAQEQSQSSLASLDEVERQFVSLKEKSKLLWRRKNTTPFFVGYKTFTQETPPEVEWTVEGLIQKQGNGLILGDSGASKSLLVAHLLLHMVAGIAWFGHAIPKRVKVGLVSREDAPGLTQNRLMRLINGGSDALNTWLSAVDLEEWLYLHTRTQRKTWSLQNEADIQDVIEAAKERGLDFLVLDVFRAIWTGNENDTQETAKVLASANRISHEAGCQVCLVHHLSKSEKGTIWDRARGGGINGWKEFGIGISIENPEAAPRERVRKVEFHTKADQAADSIYYQIDGFVDKLMLNECSAPAKPYTFRHNRKKAKPAQAGLDL